LERISDFPLSLDVADVLRGQGVDPDRARPPIVSAAQEVVAEAQALSVPAALYAILLVQDFRRQTVVLEGGAVFEGPLVARALAGATKVAVAACTIGPALEERVAALTASGDLLRAMALDGAGIAAVGMVSQVVGERMCDEALVCGLRTGMRASPGQEGWPIEQQRTLFDLLPAEQVGVRLTESCLMLPRKSVSFVVGLGPEMRAGAVPCDFCSKRERCNWRR
jgi:hypothetical protein